MGGAGGGPGGGGTFFGLYGPAGNVGPITGLSLLLYVTDVAGSSLSESSSGLDISLGSTEKKVIYSGSPGNKFEVVWIILELMSRCYVVDMQNICHIALVQSTVTHNALGAILVTVD